MNVHLFAIPKSFENPHINIIQTNALHSWLSLPKTRVTIFGSDPGVKAKVKKTSAVHQPRIKTSEQGTPYLSDAFEQAQQQPADIYLYVNSDIILLPDLIESLKWLHQNQPRFLAVGRRIDTDITEQINFESETAISDLKTHVATIGKLHSEHGIDYFAFTTKVFEQLPKFTVGRAGFDNWLILSARERGIMVTDLSQVTTVIHQNHDYGHIKGGQKKAYAGKEAQRNKALTQGNNGFCTIRDCSHTLMLDQQTYRLVPNWSLSFEEFRYFVLWTLPRIKHPIGKITVYIRKFLEKLGV